ncbi:hypothetical protein Trydic_g11279 [Trypoxylus dichotomus]
MCDRPLRPIRQRGYGSVWNTGNVRDQISRILSENRKTLKEAFRDETGSNRQTCDCFERFKNCPRSIDSVIPYEHQSALYQYVIAVIQLWMIVGMTSGTSCDYRVVHSSGFSQKN